ncbi:MAG: calcium-binding protein [Candidatus Thiodiazotropha sp.]
MNNIQGNQANLAAAHRGGCILPDTERTYFCPDGASISCHGGTATIRGTGNNDNIHAHINFDGTVDVNINGNTYHLTAEQAQNLKIEGGDGHDNIQVSGQQFGPDKDVSIDGGNGNDVIRGSSGDDVITGGFGDDWIDGGAGNDDIRGGFGNDSLIGGSGDDYLDGGVGDDGLWGGSGDDAIDGGYGNDNLIGGNGNDTMKGEQGRDNYWGGNGSDTLIIGSSDGVINAGCDSNNLFVRTRVDDNYHILTGQNDTSSTQCNNKESGNSGFNHFDPLGLFSGNFPLNLISPK